MSDSLERELKKREKRTPAGEIYYWYSDISSFVSKQTPSLSSFRRRVTEGKVHTVTVEGKEEAAFLAEDVRRFLRGDFNKQRGGARRTRTSVLSATIAELAPVAPLPLMSVAHPDDLRHIFSMEYEQMGMNAAGPHTIASWLKKNSEVYWFLSNSVDRQDIWVTLGMLPLPEDIIFRLLRNETSLNEITSDAIQAFESDKDYSFYLSIVARPESQSEIVRLIRFIFESWCKQPRGFRIKNFYIATHGLEASAAWLVVKEFYFSPRYDLSEQSHDDYAWELHLDYPNPSVDIENLKKCIDKQNEGGSSMIAAPTRRPRERLRNLSGFRPFGPEGVITKDARFRRAVTDEDIKEILRINAALFGPSKRTQEELMAARRAWLNRNPEIYHVLEYKGKIVGFLSLLPLPLEIINRLVSGEIGVSDVSLEEILPCVPGETINIFIQTYAVDPVFQSEPLTHNKFGSWLAKGTLNMIFEWGKNGIEVGKAFARSDTEYGAYTSLGLGFEEVDAPEGVHKRIFVLDMALSEQSALLGYREALEEYRQASGVSSHAQ
jgi:hypothetical protein